jgi:hypothetical protein
MEESSNLRKYVRNKKIFVPVFLGMIVCFFLLLGVTGDKIFALAVNEMAGYLVDNDSFGETELTIDDEEWTGGGTLEAAAPQGRLEEAESGQAPVEAALVNTGGAAGKDQEMFEQVVRIVQAAQADADTGSQQSAAGAPGAGMEAETATEPPPAGEPEEKQEIVRKHVNAYTAFHLRDPFYSLVRADKEMPNKLLDISRARMVGSVWGETSIIALLEDDAGRSYALKAGDKIVNGKVVSVSPASVTFSVTVFGLTKNVTLELANEG